MKSVVESGLKSRWVPQDRTRGPHMPIELVVKKQTRDSARMMGYEDRCVGARPELQLRYRDTATMHALQL
eukprot:SAG11_NODE_2984_length_2791_cov_1.161961_4_plen_70_part_00